MNQIGTLSEKSIHSTIKKYIESNEHFHEVKVGNYIADIKIDNNIFEIQTQNFKNLLNTLEKTVKGGIIQVHNFYNEVYLK